MMLAAMEFGTRFDFEREPDRMFVFEGSEYRCADVKSALDAGTPANLPKRIRRKTPHCLARLVHLIADENFRVTFLRSHLPASRAELGEDKASADRDRDVWQDLLTAFVDSNYKVCADRRTSTLQLLPPRGGGGGVLREAKGRYFFFFFFQFKLSRACVRTYVRACLCCGSVGAVGRYPLTSITRFNALHAASPCPLFVPLN